MASHAGVSSPTGPDVDPPSRHPSHAKARGAGMGRLYRRLCTTAGDSEISWWPQKGRKLLIPTLRAYTQRALSGSHVAMVHLPPAECWSSPFAFLFSDPMDLFRRPAMPRAGVEKQDCFRARC